MPFQLEDQHREILTQLVYHWDKAERRTKQAERVRKTVAGAAVNELRYGGRRMVDALKIALDPTITEDPNQFVTHIVEAKECAVKAEHDAIDAIIYFVDAHLETIEKSFRADKLLELFPKITTVKGKLAEVSHLIEQSRNERHNRHDIYDTIEADHLPVIIELHKEMVASEGLLVEAAEIANREDKKQTKEVRIGWSVGVIGTLATIFSLFK